MQHRSQPAASGQHFTRGRVAPQLPVALFLGGCRGGLETGERVGKACPADDLSGWHLPRQQRAKHGEAQVPGVAAETARAAGWWRISVGGLHTLGTGVLRHRRRSEGPLRGACRPAIDHSCGDILRRATMSTAMHKTTPIKAAKAITPRTTSAAFRRKRTDKAGVKNAAVVVVGVTLENRQRNTTSSPVSEPGQRLRALHHQCHRDRLRHRTG